MELGKIKDQGQKNKQKKNDCNWTRTQNHLVLKRTVWPNG